MSGLRILLLIEKSLFNQLGGFDRELSVSADWDFLLRLVDSADVGYVDEDLFLYRQHGDSMVRNIRNMARDMQYAYADGFSPEA